MNKTLIKLGLEISRNPSVVIQFSKTNNDTIKTKLNATNYLSTLVNVRVICDDTNVYIYYFLKFACEHGKLTVIQYLECFVYFAKPYSS